MTRLWTQAKALHDRAVERHRPRRFYQYVMGQEIKKALKAFKRKRAA